MRKPFTCFIQNSLKDAHFGDVLSHIGETFPPREIVKHDASYASEATLGLALPARFLVKLYGTVKACEAMCPCASLLVRGCFQCNVSAMVLFLNTSEKKESSRHAERGALSRLHPRNGDDLGCLESFPLRVKFRQGQDQALRWEHSQFQRHAVTRCVAPRRLWETLSSHFDGGCGPKIVRRDEEWNFQVSQMVLVPQMVAELVAELQFVFRRSLQQQIVEKLWTLQSG